MHRLCLALLVLAASLLLAAASPAAALSTARKSNAPGDTPSSTSNTISDDERRSLSFSPTFSPTASPTETLIAPYAGRVGVLAHPSLVDVSGELLFLLEDTLTAFDTADIFTFDEVSDRAMAYVTEAARTIVIPELENGDLVGLLGAGGLASLASFPGVLVTMEWNVRNTLNTVFGWSLLVSDDLSFSTNLGQLQSSAAAELGLDPSKLPATLSTPNAVRALSNLPADAVPLYVDTLGNVFVFVVPVANGPLVAYLGYDWFAAPGLEDWLAVLTALVQYTPRGSFVYTDSAHVNSDIEAAHLQLELQAGAGGTHVPVRQLSSFGAGKLLLACHTANALVVPMPTSGSLPLSLSSEAQHLLRTWRGGVLVVSDAKALPLLNELFGWTTLAGSNGEQLSGARPGELDPTTAALLGLTGKLPTSLPDRTSVRPVDRASLPANARVLYTINNAGLVAGGSSSDVLAFVAPVANGPLVVYFAFSWSVSPAVSGSPVDWGEALRRLAAFQTPSAMIFANGGFVDALGELPIMKADLAYRQKTDAVLPFVGTTATALAFASAMAPVLVFPEMESGSMAALFAADPAMQQAVLFHPGVVVFSEHVAISTINTIFGFSITAGSTNEPSDLDMEVATLIGMETVLPSSLPALNAVRGLNRLSLPANAAVLYKSTVTGDAMVAIMLPDTASPVEIIYFAYDWFETTGSEWRYVLDVLTRRYNKKLVRTADMTFEAFAPSVSPSPAPTWSPTPLFFFSPSFSPTAAPTISPTVSPTATPTSTPTSTPTNEPTSSPTPEPTTSPTPVPTHAPVVVGTPTGTPTAFPTGLPSSSPSPAPTSSPTVSPTASPTVFLTTSPTASPTASPTFSPTGFVTSSPTGFVTSSPTADASLELAPSISGFRKVQVGLYFDATHVDTTREALFVQQDLHDIMGDATLVHSFTGFDTATLRRVLAASEVLVIPELERGSPHFSMSPTDNALLNAYDGIVITMEHQAANFLNSVFGWGLTTAGTSASCSQIPANIAKLGLDPLVLPATLPARNAVRFLSNLPSAAIVLYATSSGTPAVFAVPVVNGPLVFYLAYDWFEAPDVPDWSIVLKALTRFSRTGVRVLVNPANVHVEEEAAHVIAELGLLDSTHKPIVDLPDLSAASVALAAATAHSIVVPELENTVPVLDTQARNVLRAFKGVLIFSETRALSLMNAVFGWSLVASGTFTLQSSALVDVELLNVIGVSGLPATLPARNAVRSVNRNTLPAQAIPVYMDAGGGQPTDVHVFVVPVADGPLVVYLSYDFFENVGTTTDWGLVLRKFAAFERPQLGVLAASSIVDVETTLPNILAPASQHLGLSSVLSIRSASNFSSGFAVGHFPALFIPKNSFGTLLSSLGSTGIAHLASYQGLLIATDPSTLPLLNAVFGLTLEVDTSSESTYSLVASVAADMGLSSVLPSLLPHSSPVQGIKGLPVTARSVYVGSSTGAAAVLVLIPIVDGPMVVYLGNDFRQSITKSGWKTVLEAVLNYRLAPSLPATGLIFTSSPTAAPTAASTQPLGPVYAPGCTGVDLETEFGITCQPFVLSDTLEAAEAQASQSVSINWCNSWLDAWTDQTAGRGLTLDSSFQYAFVPAESKYQSYCCPIVATCDGGTGGDGSANVIECSSCSGESVVCPIDDVTCDITCSATASCYASDFGCAKSADCNIDCLAGQSCTESYPACPTTGNCDIDCKATSACNGMFVAGPTEGSVDVSCTQRDACRDAYVSCADSDECGLTCDGANSCNNGAIFCPPGGQCNVYCSGEGSCKDLLISCTEGQCCNVAVTCAAGASCAGLLVFSDDPGGLVKTCLGGDCGQIFTYTTVGEAITGAEELSFRPQICIGSGEGTTTSTAPDTTGETTAVPDTGSTTTSTGGTTTSTTTEPTTPGVVDTTPGSTTSSTTPAPGSPTRAPSSAPTKTPTAAPSSGAGSPTSSPTTTFGATTTAGSTTTTTAPGSTTTTTTAPPGTTTAPTPTTTTRAPTAAPTQPCVLGEFESIGSCSVTCGGGTILQIQKPVEDVPACSEITLPTRTVACNTNECPIDCVVSAFGQWSECSRSCGLGTRSRTRTVLTQPNSSGKSCPSLRENVQCEIVSCALVCNVSDPSSCSHLNNACFNYRCNEGVCSQSINRGIEGYYVLTASGQQTCEPVKVCTASQYEVSGPTDVSDRVCQALTVCTSTQFEATPPSSTSDRVCQAYDIPPVLSREHYTASMLLSQAVGQPLSLGISATVGGTHTLFYSLNNTDLFNINSLTGVVTLARVPTVTSDQIIRFEVVVTDSRSSCVVQGQAPVEGGCRDTATVAVQIVAFASCPSGVDRVTENPNGTVVSWTAPQLGSGLTVVELREPATPSGSFFAVGETEVVYEADVLGADEAVRTLICRFTVTVKYGFSHVVSDIGHFFHASSSGVLLRDFLLDDSGQYGASSVLPTVTLPNSGEDDDFSIAILPKEGEVFDMNLPAGQSARMRLLLQWCASGGSFPDDARCVAGVNRCKTCSSTSLYTCIACEGTTAVLHLGTCWDSCPSGYVSNAQRKCVSQTTGQPADPVTVVAAETQVSLRAVSETGESGDFSAVSLDIAFTSGARSGMTSDGLCYRAHAQSEVLTGSNSFGAIVISLIGAGGGGRRRRSGGLSYTAFFPMSPSSFMAEIDVGVPPPTTDPGTYVTVQDLQPPVFTFCPDDVDVVAPPGETEVMATWTLPTAQDNVAVTMSSTAVPGANFTIKNSPHNVVYTAVDPSNLQSTCSFKVRVSYVAAETALEVRVTQTDITTSVRSSAALGVYVAGDVLAHYASPPSTDWTVDVGAFTAMNFVVNASDSGFFELKAAEDAAGARLEVDLAWVAPGASPVSVPAALNDAFISVSFVGLQTRNGDAASLPEDFAFISSSSTVVTENYVRMTGFSTVVPEDLQFAAVVVSLKYPRGRTTGGGAVTLEMDVNSFVQVAYFFQDPADVVLTAAELSERYGFLSVVDVVPPVFFGCPASVVILAQTGQPFGNVSWAEPIAFDNIGVKKVTSTAAPGTSFPITVPGTAPSTVTYRAEDFYGGVGLCSFTVTVLDRQAPAITCPADATVLARNGSLTTVLEASLFVPTAVSDNSGNVSVSVPELERGVGEHVIELSATDPSNNRKNCTFRLRLVDTEPPFYERCPSNTLAQGTAGASTTAVVWVEPDAFDSQQTSVAATQTHSPGDLFTVGQTTQVRYVATDNAGNQAECTFDVTVLSADAAKGGDASKSGGGSSLLLFAAGGGAGLLLIALVVVLVVSRRRRHRQVPHDFQKTLARLEGEGLDLDENGLRKPREIKRGAVRILEVLGKGAFGEVSKAILEENTSAPGYLVAVKSMLEGSASDREELLSEAAVMAQFADCPRVNRLIGVVTAGEPLMIILEYCEHGALNHYLSKSEVSEETRWKFAGDCAEGLAYLASKNYVHRDVAARNVLVSSELRAKISDYGMSRRVDNSLYYQSAGGRLPIRWSSPEALQDNKFSTASDCWAYGVLLYEIWTNAKLPYKGWDNRRVWVEVLAGFRLPCPEGCAQEVHGMMLECWSANPKERPSFEQLTAFFRKKFMGDNDEAGEAGCAAKVASDSNVGNNYERPVASGDVPEAGAAAAGGDSPYLVPSACSGEAAGGYSGGQALGGGAAGEGADGYLAPSALSNEDVVPLRNNKPRKKAPAPPSGSGEDNYVVPMGDEDSLRGSVYVADDASGEQQLGLAAPRDSSDAASSSYETPVGMVRSSPGRSRRAITQSLREAKKNRRETDLDSVVVYDMPGEDGNGGGAGGVLGLAVQSRAGGGARESVYDIADSVKSDDGEGEDERPPSAMSPTGSRGGYLDVGDGGEGEGEGEGEQAATYEVPASDDPASRGHQAQRRASQMSRVSLARTMSGELAAVYDSDLETMGTAVDEVARKDKGRGAGLRPGREASVRVHGGSMCVQSDEA